MQGEYHSWCSRGEDDDFRNAYCSRYILLLLWTNCWLEICTCSLSLSLNIIPGFYASASVIKIISISHCPQPSIFTTQEMAHDKTQKYKEGKFVLERYMAPSIILELGLFFSVFSTPMIKPALIFLILCISMK